MTQLSIQMNPPFDVTLVEDLTVLFAGKRALIGFLPLVGTFFSAVVWSLGSGRLVPGIKGCPVTAGVGMMLEFLLWLPLLLDQLLTGWLAGWRLLAAGCGFLWPL